MGATERQRSRLARGEAQSRYRRLVEGSPAVFYVFSTRRGGIFYSSQVESLIGYPVAYLLAHPFVWNRSIHPDDRWRVQEAVEGAVCGKRFAVEYRLKDARGQWLWLQDCSIEIERSGNEAIVEGVAVDITARKEAQEGLRSSEAKYRGLAETSFDTIFITDLHGIITYVSPAAERLLRTRAVDVVGEPFIRFVVDPQVPRVSDLLRRVLAGRDIEAVEMVLARRDGGHIIVELNAQRVSNAGGEPVGVQGIIRDVTERKESEFHLRTLQAQLTHISRIATLGEMAAGLVHELSRPLAHIATWAEVGARQLRTTTDEGRKECQEALVQIRDQIDHLGAVLQRMRGFVGTADFRKVPLDVATAVDDVCSLMASDLFDANVTLRVDLPVGLPRVLADRSQIQQVLANLIRNAAESMEGREPAERRLAITADVQEGSVRVSVCDAGNGVSATEDVYNPFFTTKPAGMGLGLSISRTIIRAHRGRLGHRPNADRGTTFFFTLPIARTEEDDQIESDRSRGG